MRRATWQHIVLSLLIVAITLALGWLSGRIEVASDMTANRRHALTEASIRAVQQLGEPVEIIAVIGRDQATRDALTELVSRFQQHNPMLSLRFINPETDPAGARALNAAPGGELILRGMGREQRLRSASERALSSALRKLNRQGERLLAFISGHDERSPSDPGADHWATVAAQLQRIGLNSEELSLVSKPRIADTVDVLVIADPRRAYFPGEIASLLEYINQGGNLLWLVETPLQQGGQASMTDPKLDALALELGISTLPGIVIDTASQSANLGSADFVVIDRFGQHPVTRGLASPLLLPQVTALQVTPLAGQTLLPLIQTPESSWTETGKLAGAISFDENSEEQNGPLILGLTIERQIGDRQQRIAVIGDADFGASQFVGNGDNQAFIESLMLWLAGDSEALSFVSVAPPDSSLTLSSRDIVLISIAFLVLLPLALLLAAGVIAWRRRR